MNEDEKYFFDLSGYIVVRNVLSVEDIALANEAIDRRADQIRERTGELSLSAGSKALEGVDRTRRSRWRTFVARSRTAALSATC